MASTPHLQFLSNIVREKFVYLDNGSICPFCNRAELVDILAEEGSIVLLKNKFTTLADAFQTVLIESDDCHADITTYDPALWQKIITFGTNHWLAMESSGEYSSVLFFKNHGPLSGGTVNHAHMQIIGLKEIDYRDNLTGEIFEGIEIYKEDDCLLNISTKPQSCAMEFNISTPSRNDRFMSVSIKNAVTYILKNIKCSSYNLFFYQWKNSIVCKVMPRYVTSPFLVGYAIPQTSNRLSGIAEEMRGMFYS